MVTKNYHCCATCIHFKAIKLEKNMKYLCTRLGFETKTSYKFDCWNPRDDIKLNMNKK